MQGQVKYYCHLESGDIKIFKGTWTQVSEEAGRRSIATGTLSGKKNTSLEKAIAHCEEGAKSLEFPSFHPKHTTFVDCTQAGNPECKLSDAPEYRRISTSGTWIKLDDFLASMPSEAKILEAIAAGNPIIRYAETTTGRTLLHYVVGQGMSTDTISQLLHAAPSITNGQDREGLTALHLAASARNYKAVEALLKTGADHKLRLIDESKDAHKLPFNLIVGDDERALLTAQKFSSVEHKGIQVNMHVDEGKWLVQSIVFLDAAPRIPPGIIDGLAREFPHCFSRDDRGARNIKPGLQIRHKVSVSWHEQNIQKKYQGKNIQELLAEHKASPADIGTIIANEFHKLAYAKENLFIGDKTENLAYGSAIPDINRAYAENRALQGAEKPCNPVTIIIDPTYRSVFARHPCLKRFYNEATFTLSAATHSDIVSLYNLLHRDDPRYATIPVAPPIAAVALVAPAVAGHRRARVPDAESSTALFAHLKSSAHRPAATSGAAPT